MSLPRTDETENKQQTAYFSREQLKAQDRKLHSNHHTEEIPEQIQTSYADENLQELQEEMNNIAYMRKALAAVTNQNAETSILLATVEKLGVIHQDFLMNTSKQFDSLNEKQLSLLNIQNEYAKSVQKSVYEMAVNIYRKFYEEQNKAFQEIRKSLEADTDKMIDKINTAAKSAEKSAKTAVKISEKIRRIDSWKTLLFYLSPIAVIIDVIIRLIMYYSK